MGASSHPHPPPHPLLCPSSDVAVRQGSAALGFQKRKTTTATGVLLYAAGVPSMGVSYTHTAGPPTKTTNEERPFHVELGAGDFRVIQVVRLRVQTSGVH